MGFWDTAKQLGGSVINLINSSAIKAIMYPEKRTNKK